MSDDRLLCLVKRENSITWDDEETDALLLDIIEDAKIAVADKIGITTPNGVPYDFTEPGQERRLLLAYCFYAWNKSLDEFDRNYMADILQAREKWEVSGYGIEA